MFSLACAPYYAILFFFLVGWLVDLHAWTTAAAAAFYLVYFFLRSCIVLPSLAALILASSFLDASARRRLILVLQRIETIGRRGQLSIAKKKKPL
jgi:uncharacterized membrane protein YczE